MTASDDYVFISYSRQDITVVRRAASHLNERGVRTWIDLSDIPASVPWSDEIADGIRGSALVVAFDSFAFFASTPCASELKAANTYGVKVLHVDADETSPDQVLAQVESYLRSRTPDQRARTELLVRAGQWIRASRSSRLLVRGTTLKKYLLVSRADPTLPVDVGRFLRASRSRQTRNAVLAALGVCLAWLVARGGNNLVKLNEDTTERVLNEIDTLTAIAHFSDTLDHNVYAGMDNLSIQSELEGLLLGQIVRAMAIDVPTAVEDETAGGQPQSVSLPDGADPTLAGIVATSGCAALDETESLLAACDSGSATVSVYDTGTGALVLRAPVADASQAVAFSPDSRALAIGSGEDVLLLSMTGVAGSATTLTGSIGAVERAGFSEDGQTVWAVTSAGKRVTWRTPGGRTLFYDPDLWPMDSTTVPSTGQVVILGRDGRIATIVPAEPDRPREERWRAPGVAVAVAAHPTEPLLAIAYSSDDVGFLGLLRPGTRTAASIELPCLPRDVAFGLDRAYVACPASEVLEVDYGDRSISRLALEGHMPTSVAVVGDHLLVGTATGLILEVSEEFDSTEGRVDYACPQTAEALVGTPDGRWVFNAGVSAARPTCAARLSVGDLGGTWTRDMFAVGPVAQSEARGLAVSPDSSLVAYGFADGTVVLHTTEDLNPTSIHRGFGSEIRGLAFTSDAEMLVVTSRDGRVSAIDVAADHASPAQLRQRLGERVDTAIALGFYTQPIAFDVYEPKAD